MRSLLGLLALSALLAACTPAVEPEAPPVEPIALPEPPKPERLGDVEWRITNLKGVALPDGLMQVSFAGGFITGNVPCNEIRGNYLGTGPIFLVETLVRTKIDCDKLPLEEEIVLTLLQAKSADITEGILTVRGEEGPLMQFAPVYQNIEYSPQVSAD